MDDWQVGDLALCVLGKEWAPHQYDERAPDECSPVISMLFPRIGSEWRVAGVEVHFRPEEQRDCVYLSLCGQPSDVVFDARFFRKINPLTEEECRSFLADLPQPVEA